MNKNIRAGVLAGCALMSLTGAGVVSGCKAPRFGNMISKSEQISLGRDASQDVERRYKIITTGPSAERLARVAARIIPLARRDFDVPYSVKCVDSKEVNAFALPGGPIYFYKGLVDLAQSDDELAAVLGHEATHVVKQHSAKQMSDAQAKGLIASIALGRASGLAQTGVGLFLQLEQLSYSRGDEAEADENGFRYLTEAGYDPNAMASFFERLKEQEGKNGGGPEWLSDHPLTEKRIQAAQKRADDYRAARTATP